MISKERAVELVEQALLREHRGRLFPEDAEPPEVVFAVVEHEFGWLVSLRSREWRRTGDSRHLIVGGGPILVDGQDGSVHMIPIVTYKTENWQDAYRRRFEGPVPTEATDSLGPRVARVLADDGRLAALRVVRKEAPALDLKQAQAYVRALELGEAPSHDLTSPAEPDGPTSDVSLIRMAGPDLGP